MGYSPFRIQAPHGFGVEFSLIDKNVYEASIPIGYPRTTIPVQGNQLTGWMIIRGYVAPMSMGHEDSEIYIGQQEDGTLITMFEYVEKAADRDQPPTVVCPMCAHDGEEQPLTYVPTECRFVHTDVDRECYQDHRTHEPDHPLAQQTAYREFHNRTQFRESDIEYSLSRYRGENKLLFDIGAKWSSDTALKGVVVEIQHQSGCFSRRLYPRLKAAHSHNYGVFVLFTPRASGRQWFGRQFGKMGKGEIEIGSYRADTVDWGTMIQPNDDISVFEKEIH